jgi:hypothetical protein
MRRQDRAPRKGRTEIVEFMETGYHAFFYLRYTVQFDYDLISVALSAFTPFTHEEDQSPR